MCGAREPVTSKASILKYVNLSTVVYDFFKEINNLFTTMHFSIQFLIDSFRALVLKFFLIQKRVEESRKLFVNRESRRLILFPLRVLLTFNCTWNRNFLQKIAQSFHVFRPLDPLKIAKKHLNLRVQFGAKNSWEVGSLCKSGQI
jgi:hypothetical protein